MKTQAWTTLTCRVGLILLPSLIVFHVGVSLAQIRGLSSDFYLEGSRIHSVENHAFEGNGMADKSNIDPRSNYVHKIELSEEAAIWNQRMRRNWSKGDTASSGQDCLEGSTCSSIAIGKGATARMGTVTVDGPKVKGTIGTKSHVNQSSNMAIGKGATANMGNVTVHGSRIKGMVTNQSRVSQSANKAIGKGATANMGSVTVHGSSIKGTVTNQSRVKRSANKAIGKGAIANMGSISID